MRRMRRMLGNKVVLFPLALALLVAGAVGFAMLAAGSAVADDGGHGQRTVRVDCSRGQSLNHALSSEEKASVVEFTGTCTGSVNVGRSDVTLRGADPSATVVGGPITIFGQSRVTLDGFTVRDAPPGPPNFEVGQCIQLTDSQAISIEDLNVVNCGNFGIEIVGSTGEIADTTVTQSGVIGISIVENSYFEVDDVKVTHGKGQGIVIAENGTLDMERGSSLELTDNLGSGLLVQLKGHATLNGQTNLIADRNGIGLNIIDQGSIFYADANIEVANNQTIGVQLGQLADWTIVGGVVPTVKITNNGGPGISVLRNAFLRLRENTTITGNGGPGLVVDGAGVAVRGTTVQNNNGNHGDVILSFRSTATFDGGNTLGTPLSCDGTALARGQFVCS